MKDTLTAVGIAVIVIILLHVMEIDELFEAILFFTILACVKLERLT